MRFKFTRLPPAPDDRQTLWRAHESVPKTPDPESDCCGRIAHELGVDRSRAQEWFTLLRALELVRGTARGYVRLEGRPEDEVLAERLFDRIYGAPAVRSALEAAGGSASKSTVFEAVAETAPGWERLRRNRTWRQEWEAGFDRLLAWLEALGAVDREGETLRLVHI